MNDGSSRSNSNKKPEYGIILGQGRSGTNWLLDLLDISPMTYCRNEADKLSHSPLRQVPSGQICQAFGDSFGQQWDLAIQQSALRMGKRDRIGIYPKFYLSEVQRTVGRAILSRQKLRQLGSVLFPDLKQSTWSVPSWYASSSALKESLPIFKLNQSPGWGEWLLKNRPQALVIHIVRHPGGFLNSWKKRYVVGKNTDTILYQNQERLKRITKVDSEWSERFGDISAMTVEESELWYWYYANEKIYEVGKGRENYLNIIYENLVNDPIEITKILYQKCHLTYTQNIEEIVQQNSTESQQIAKKWEDILSEKEIMLVEQFLKNNTIYRW